MVGRYCRVVLLQKGILSLSFFDSWRKYLLKIWFRNMHLAPKHTWLNKSKDLLNPQHKGHVAGGTVWNWRRALRTELLIIKSSCSSDYYSYLHEQDAVDVSLHTKAAVIVDARMLSLSQARDAGDSPPVQRESMFQPWPPTSRRKGRKISRAMLW